MIATRNSPLLLVLSLVVSFALPGCSSNTAITHSYVDPKLNLDDLHGVLVVAVTQKKTARVQFENAFVRALDKHGVQAIASHTKVPKTKAEPEELLAAAQKAGLDTILVTRYIGKSNEEVYHPGTVYYGVTPAYGGGYNRGFGGYYWHAYEVAYQQPVWTNNVTHSLISDLYAVQSKEHLWQAVSDTLQAGSTDKARGDAIKALIGNLKDQGLLH